MQRSPSTVYSVGSRTPSPTTARVHAARPDPDGRRSGRGQDGRSFALALSVALTSGGGGSGA